MKIVCLGDSLTAGYGVNSEVCWVSILQKETSGDWVNAGLNGDTSGGMLARLNRDVFLRRPDAALLMGGINDILLTGSCSSAKANLMAMVQQCVAQKVRPIVGIPIPLYADAIHPWTALLDFQEATQEQKMYVSWLRVFTKTFHLRTVDFCGEYEQFMKRAGCKRAFLPDGLHPTEEGHRVMADTVKQSKIRQFLTEG